MGWRVANSMGFGFYNCLLQWGRIAHWQVDWGSIYNEVDAAPVMVKRELRQHSKFFIHQSIFFPVLNYGHKLWLVAEKLRLWKQMTEMNFLLPGLTIGITEGVILEGLKIESLPHCIKISELR